jgi:hypothetical protein
MISTYKGQYTVAIGAPIGGKAFPTLIGFQIIDETNLLLDVQLNKFPYEFITSPQREKREIKPY